ncbi:MAG: YlxM family DNA-binding protein [Acetatifactor sp.]
MDSVRDTDQLGKIYMQTMLFDFYGELLTEHQKQVYEDAVYNDLSLSEIAETYGISRQGVHDLIKRCDKLLQGYEDKLHLIERFGKAKETVRLIQTMTEISEEGAEVLKKRLEDIRILAENLLQEI